MFTWQAAVIAAYTVSLPLMVRAAQAAIEAVDKELEYAAYILGRSETETALLITLPLAKRGILAGWYSVLQGLSENSEQHLCLQGTFREKRTQCLSRYTVLFRQAMMNLLRLWS